MSPNHLSLSRVAQYQGRSRGTCFLASPRFQGHFLVFQEESKSVIAQNMKEIRKKKKTRSKDWPWRTSGGEICHHHVTITSLHHSCHSRLLLRLRHYTHTVTSLMKTCTMEAPCNCSWAHSASVNSTAWLAHTDLQTQLDPVSCRCPTSVQGLNSDTPEHRPSAIS